MAWAVAYACIRKFVPGPTPRPYKVDFHRCPCAWDGAYPEFVFGLIDTVENIHHIWKIPNFA